VICLSGVHQIAIARDQVSGRQRIDVGHRPTALAMDLRQGRIYVANTQDDSISVVDIERQEVVKTIILGLTPELSIADRGERLFHDARLTLDGWYSCHSCHTDGHSNGQLNDNFGDDEIGTPKRVLSLLGVNSTGPWGWNGHQLWINTQVVKSIRTTMQNDAVEKFAVDGGVAAITDYLRSFEPPPSLLVARGEPIDTPEIARGREVFARFDCGRCHAPPVYTTAQVYDVGLEDEVGQVEFNPPSLRGVSQRAAWLHDNRAQRLSDVFTTYGHPHESTFDLSADDIDALVQFLNTL
jgi:YVTN family beta-propeller protein